MKLSVMSRETKRILAGWRPPQSHFSRWEEFRPKHEIDTSRSRQAQLLATVRTGTHTAVDLVFKRAYQATDHGFAPHPTDTPDLVIWLRQFRRAGKNSCTLAGQLEFDIRALPELIATLVSCQRVLEHHGVLVPHEASPDPTRR